MIANKKNNQQLKEFCIKIFAVPERVKRYVLKKFVVRCQEKHCLAFF